MRIILKIMFFSHLFVFDIGQNCNAYDVEHTHQYINLRAADESKADSIIENSLGFPGGTDYELNG